MGEGGSSTETWRICGPGRGWLLAATALLGTFASVAGLRADEPATPAALPAFEAGDISIGEPIPLPFKPPAMAPQVSPPAAPSAAPPPISLPAPPPTVAAPAAMASPAAGAPPAASPSPGAPGNGWLGIVVAESATPGRWKIDRVDAEGPAAAAGIRVGDEVRAINGLPLRNSDDVAQALTVIAPGQQVRLAIARDEQLADVTLAAIPRPPAARAWVTAATAQEIPPAPTAALPPPAAAAIPPQPTAPPAFARDIPPRFSSPSAAAPQPERLPAAVEPPTRATEPVAGGRGRTALGVRTVPIDPGMQARFGLPEASGAYVIGVVGDLPASKAGVPPGSVIVAIDQRPVRSPDELTRLVTAGPVGKPVPLDYVLPGGTSRRAEVVLQTLEQPLEQALLGQAGPAATQVPTLLPQPAPTTARRPATATDDAPVLREAIRRLEARIESLERRLQAR